MPNVVRTVTRSTMIEQYLDYSKEQCHEPLSRSTLFKILEVRGASQHKSLQGLDNTSADGAVGFQTLEKLVEALEKGRMEKQWCLDVRRKLRAAKRYLKTDFHVHCQPRNPTCADHCRHFALRDPVDADLQQLGYVNSKSNHPPRIIQNIPKSINQRLSEISSDKESFDQAAPLYQNALHISGYNHTLSFSSQSARPSSSKNNRPRNVIWYNPPFSRNVATNVGRSFFKILDEEFPTNNILHKIQLR